MAGTETKVNASAMGTGVIFLWWKAHTKRGLNLEGGVVDVTPTTLITLKDVAAWSTVMNVSAAVRLGMGRRSVAMKGGVAKAMVNTNGFMLASLAYSISAVVMTFLRVSQQGTLASFVTRILAGLNLNRLATLPFPPKRPKYLTIL